MSGLTHIQRATGWPGPRGNGDRQRLGQAVQAFEGVLWSEVADAMLSVKLGRTNLGFAGTTYQHMLWRMVTERDFGSIDQALTKATLEQLAPGVEAVSTTGPGKPVAGQAPSGEQVESRSGPRVSRPGAVQNDHVESPIGTGRPLPAPAVPNGPARFRTTAQAVRALPAVPAPRTADQAHTAGESVLNWARHIWGHIVKAARALDVPAQALLAQSALETGWGRDTVDHNLFGIKAHGDAPSFLSSTFEYIDGIAHRTEATFERYKSDAQAIADFVNVIRSSHPAAVGQATVAGFASALQATGYATDPRYAQKIEAIAHSSRMQNLLQSVQERPLATNNTAFQNR